MTIKELRKLLEQTTTGDRGEALYKLLKEIIDELGSLQERLDSLETA